MRLPDLNLLIAFDVLLEEGSATAAARRLNISAPAMSRTLNRIRDAFGDPVLVRSGRGLAPTPRALELREQVRALIEQAHLVFTAGREVDLMQLERTFNLRANDVFVGTFGSRLRQLLDRHAPRTVLRFVSEGDVDDRAMEEGRIDLYISGSRNFSPDTKTQSLFRTGFVGLARADHPLFDAPIDAERFVAHAHISVSRRGRASGPIDDALARQGLARRVTLVTPNFHSAIFALAGSDLILPLMPTSMLDSVRALGLTLRDFTLPVALEPVNIVQAWHPRLDNDDAHRWLRRLLKQACSTAAA
ncbi:MAG: Nodulation protein D 2 [Herbaspirillum frisingense]|uniref:Nodulation protein D 2 n=1 Tax=Herbaspirillum frisingense TaxID=92645 RepID=A0A7V8JWH6_9BURK|nr:MAG: Nodulation protein D 2 [Herbaspirillum frisingense]